MAENPSMASGGSCIDGLWNEEKATIENTKAKTLAVVMNPLPPESGEQAAGRPEARRWDSDRILDTVATG